MKLFQAFHNSSFILSFLLFACQIIVVHAQTATLGAGPTQTSGPANATFEVGWKPTSSRGTSELLRSCFVTIVLALWSSVVLNIQMAHGDTLHHVVLLSYKGELGTDVYKPMRFPFLHFRYYKQLLLSAKAQFKSRAWVRWQHKILWAGLNLMFPELALGIALDENDTASRLLCFLQNKKKENTDKSIDVFSTWDMSVAFYAVSGGFYVPEPESALEGYYIPGIKSVPQGLVERCCEVNRMRMEYLAEVRKARQRDPSVKFGGPNTNKPKRVLTAEGVVYIANLMDKLKGCNTDPESGIGRYCGLPQCRCIEDGERLQAQFADISPQILADLSKGNSLARILFALQAVWMIAQSLVRWRSSLSLTLLELQTAAHVGIATVRYCVWYNKPIDIVLMTPLSLTEAQYKTMLDDLGSTQGITGHFKFEKSLIRKITGDESFRGFNGLESNTLAGNQTEIITEIPKEGMTDGRTDQITVDEKIPDLESNTLAGNQVERITEIPKKGMTDGRTEQITVDKKMWWKRLWLWDMNQIQPGNLAYVTSQATLGKNAYQQAGGGWPFFRRPFQTALQATAAFTLSCHSGWWLFRVYLCAIVCIVYNGINLLAWNWYFPSNFEKIAWRVCAVLVCACIISVTIGGLLGHLYYLMAKYVQPPHGLYRAGVRIGNIIFWILGLPWVVAKVFIFIESLISLRKLPADIYEVASWASFLPHL